MKSGELARIAGVSVRTLRHYHALGLLPEPPRHDNGYRDYDVSALARVLHIKQLASLGFSLADIGTMLERPEGTSRSSSLEADALDQLDEELEAQIERLQEQRRVVAQLREEQLDPALPPRFARAVKRLYREDKSGVTASNAKAEEDRAALMIVAAQFYDENAMAELERFADKAEELGIVDELIDLEHRIGALPPDASEKQRTDIVDEALALLGPTIDCFDPANWQEESSGAVSAVLDSLLDRSFNAAQKDVDERIEAVIVARMRERSARSEGSSESSC